MKKQPVVMPFGKHKGKEMKELTTQYLEWADRNFTNGWLLREIQAELNRRQHTIQDKVRTRKVCSNIIEQPVGKFMNKLAKLLVNAPKEICEQREWWVQTPIGFYMFVVEGPLTSPVKSRKIS